MRKAGTTASPGSGPPPCLSTEKRSSSETRDSLATVSRAQAGEAREPLGGRGLRADQSHDAMTRISYLVFELHSLFLFRVR